MPTKEEIETFSLSVVQVVKDKSISYLDALVNVCELNKIEAEVAATLLDVVIKDRIEREAEVLNLMKTKKARLPI